MNNDLNYCRIGVWGKQYKCHSYHFVDPIPEHFVFYPKTMRQMKPYFNTIGQHLNTFN